MNVRQMEYLLAIAERKNLAGAAAACCISPSALSQSLAKMEDLLGVTLFIRDKNKWVPTPAGELSLQAAGRILEIRDRLLKDIRTISAAGKQTIVLGMTSERASIVFPLVYSRFQNEFPDMSIKLVEKYFFELQHMVMDREVDLSLSIVPALQRGEKRRTLRCAYIGTEELVLIVPPSHPFISGGRGKSGTPVRLEDLSGENFVCLSKQRVLRHELDDAFKRFAIRPRELFEVTSTRSAIEFVGKGMGISFVTKLFALSSPSVRVVPTAPRLTCDLGVLYRKEKKLTEPERRLISLITEELRQSLAPARGGADAPG